MEQHPLLLDESLGSLVGLLQGASNRAEERLVLADRAVNALRSIIHITRTDNLLTHILLFSDESSRIMARPHRITAFRKLAEMAGSTPEERLSRLTHELEKQRYTEIWAFSGLSKEETLAIIQGD